MLKSLIKKLSKEKESFLIEASQEGLTFSLDEKTQKRCRSGEASSWLMHQKVALSMLDEEGVACKTGEDFLIPTEYAVSLDKDTAKLLNLPKPYSGRFEISVSGKSTSNEFSIRIIPIFPDGTKAPHFTLLGPYLSFGERERYLLSSDQFLVVSSVETHSNLPSEEKTENRNLNLVATLQQAKKQGVDLDLSHFNDLEIIVPETVGVSAYEQSDGSLMLCPTFGTGDDPNFIEKRIGQLDSNQPVGSLRAGKRIICLDEERMSAAAEVLSNKRIPKEQVGSFLEAPTAFLNAAKIDLDMGFSLRVRGAERYKYIPFGENSMDSQGWFDNDFGASNIKKLRGLTNTFRIEDIVSQIEAAQGQGCSSITIANVDIDLSNPKELFEDIQSITDEVQKEVHAPEEEPKEDIKPVDRSSLAVTPTVLSNGELRSLATNSSFTGDFDLSNFKRHPLPHQDEGIRWMLGMLKKALNRNAAEMIQIQGCLLGDDMGTGKTMQSLSTVQLMLNRLEFEKAHNKPILVVAPLSLLNGWREEIEKAFHRSPFLDVVTLQTDADLARFRVEGAKSEVKQSFETGDTLDAGAIRYSLKVGKAYGIERLDMPKRLILTTYQGLRDYQFSLCKIDFSCVFLDEAQNTKSPNTLQTRAAKALKADLKVAVTGTPVENSLSDIWCLFDVVQPGLLGDWDHFRSTYVNPPGYDDHEPVEKQIELGKLLRKDIGPFMLRRMKADHLKGLPPKTIYTGVFHKDDEDYVYLPELDSVMQGEQLHAYNEILLQYNNASQGEALPLLHKLREASLHPGLLGDEHDMLTSTAEEARKKICESAKLESTLKILESIQEKGEKAILFATNKKLQRNMKIWFEQIFGIEVSIVNGDTKAKVISINRKSSQKASLSRSEIIDKFQKHSGFSILIMSPVAAGVGLTICSSNHVFHVERHWNPAKEDQASDRVYRIGQVNPVSIYLPASRHPDFTSFDVHLDNLLRSKINLKDAVVVPTTVKADNFGGALDAA